MRVRRVIAPAQQHHARADEAGEVVDMPVGLIAWHALAHPDDVADAEVILEHTLHLLAGAALVAVLIQHALLGDQDGALAIHVNRAALYHQRGAEAFGALEPEDFLRHLVV